MWSLKRAEPRCIRKEKMVCKRQIEGNASIYVITMMLMLFLIFFFKMMMNDQRLQVTKDTVDDALVGSLIAASPINMTEYGKSGQLVIYDDVTEYCKTFILLINSSVLPANIHPQITSIQPGL